MDTKLFFSVYNNQYIEDIITWLKHNVIYDKCNISYMESNMNNWTIDDMYNYYHMLFVNMVITPIVYYYDWGTHTYHILHGGNIVKALMLLINNQIEVPMSLFDYEADDTKVTFDNLRFDIKRRMYSAHTVMYEIKLNFNNNKTVNDVMNMLKFA